MTPMRTTLVADLMTREVITLAEDQDFVSGAQVMQLERVRHLPVVRGERLVGLVTHRDLLRAQAKLMDALADAPKDEEVVVSVRVRDIMSEALITCSPDTPADDAARMMLDAKIGCVLVTNGDDERLAGIVTETDLVKWAVEVMAKMRFEGA